MKKAFSILVVLILYGTQLFAQVKFIASASKTSLGIGEQFELKFSIKGNANQFFPPDLSDFQVLYGPNASFNQTVNNGDTTFDILYKYILVAKKEGAFDIGAATIVVSGQTFSSNSFKINVKGHFQAGQQQIKLLCPSAEDSTRATLADTKTLSKQIFIHTEADKTHTYVGEQIKVNYKLYTRVDIVKGQLEKIPALKGGRIKDVVNPKGQENPWTVEKVNGIYYRATIIKQFMIYPEHVGDLTIPALTIDAVLKIAEKGTLGDSSNNYHQLNYQLKSMPVIVHVKALSSK